MLETLRAQHDANATDGLRALGRGVLSGVQGVLLDPLRGDLPTAAPTLTATLTALTLRPPHGIMESSTIHPPSDP